MVKWRENPNAVPGTYAAVVVGGELSIVVISVEAGESWGLTGQPAWPTKSMRYHFRKEKKKRCHLWNGNLCFPLASMCMRKHTHPQGKYTQGPRVFSTAGVPLNAILYSPGVSDTQPSLVGWVASLRSCAPRPPSFIEGCSLSTPSPFRRRWTSPSGLGGISSCLLFSSQILQKQRL